MNILNEKANFMLLNDIGESSLKSEWNVLSSSTQSQNNYLSINSDLQNEVSDNEISYCDDNDDDLNNLNNINNNANNRNNESNKNHNENSVIKTEKAINTNIPQSVTNHQDDLDIISSQSNKTEIMARNPGVSSMNDSLTHQNAATHIVIMDDSGQPLDKSGTYIQIFK